MYITYILYINLFIYLSICLSVRPSVYLVYMYIRHMDLFTFPKCPKHSTLAEILAVMLNIIDV